MEFRGYRVEADKNSVIVDGVRDFDLIHTFECGQCFRWTRQADGSYNGIAGDRAVNVSYDGRRLKIYNASIDDLRDFWFEYFDLGTDYTKIKKALAKDDAMRVAVEYGYGIRILRQDFWETLISFIISVNNRIPRIKKIVESISRIYGREVFMDGIPFYTFPDSCALASSSPEKIGACGGGFRCKYILKTATAVNAGKINHSAMKTMNTDQARQELMKLPGVGPKVADCVLLYSGIKRDVFPTDVWVKRVMEELYFGREAGFGEIQAFSSEYFRDLRGYAQQYLFYYARDHKIGVGLKRKKL